MTVAAPSPYSASPVATPPVARSTAAVLPLTIGVAAAALVAGIVNAVFGAMFPSNAPIEQIYNVGVTADLIAITITLAVRTLVIFRLPHGVSTRRPSVFGILAAVFALVTLSGWFLLGGGEYWFDGMARYMSGAGGTFYLGALWVLSIVFGEIAVRRSDTGINRALALGALVISALVGVATVAAAVIYGLGMSA